MKLSWLKLFKSETQDLQKAPVEYITDPQETHKKIAPLNETYPLINKVTLPNGLVYQQHTKNDFMGPVHVHHLYHPNEKNPIAEVITRPDPDNEMNHKVSYSQVSPDHKGKGLGKQAYLAALIHGKGVGRLLSDNELSRNAHKMWTSLKGVSGLGGKIGSYVTHKMYDKGVSPAKYAQAHQDQHQVFVKNKKALDHNALFPSVDMGGNVKETKMAASEENVLPDIMEKGLKGDWQKEGYTFHHEDWNDDGQTPNFNPLEHDFKIVASKNGKPVGYAYVNHLNQKQITPHDVSVNKMHRRKGIASGMYSYAEKIANKKMANTYEDQSKAAEFLWAQPNRPFGKSDLNKSRTFKTSVSSVSPSIGLERLKQIKQDHYVGAGGKDYDPDELHQRMFEIGEKQAAKQSLFPEQESEKTRGSFEQMAPPMPGKKMFGKSDLIPSMIEKDEGSNNPENTKLLYHGAPSKIYNKIKNEGFKLTSGQRSGPFGSIEKVQNQGIFLSDTPAVAHFFGQNRSGHEGGYTYGVHKVNAALGNNLDLTQKWPSTLKNIGLNLKQKYDGSKSIKRNDIYWLLDKPEFVNHIKELGYHSVKFPESKSLETTHKLPPSNTYMVFDPSKLSIANNLGKSETLEKGIARKKWPYNPKGDYSKIPKRHWFTGSGNLEDRDEIPKIEGNARERGLHRLSGMTKVKIDENGKRHFLLHRGIGEAESSRFVKDSVYHNTSNKKTSWTPDHSVALWFSGDPHGSRVISSYIPEDQIHHIPFQTGYKHNEIHKPLSQGLKREKEIIISHEKPIKLIPKNEAFELAIPHSQYRHSEGETFIDVKGDDGYYDKKNVANIHQKINEKINKPQKLAASELEKAIAPKDFGKVKTSHNKGFTSSIDFKNQIKDHPAHEGYLNHVVNNPEIVKNRLDRSGGIATKMIHDVKPKEASHQLSFDDKDAPKTEPATYMTKPYFAHAESSTKSYSKHPIKGWATLTTKDLLHAADMGHMAEDVQAHVHNEVPVTVHKFSEEHEPIVGGSAKIHPLDAQKIAVMDFLTGNNDRHSGNIMVSKQPYEDKDRGELYHSPLLIDHERNFQYNRTLNNKFGKYEPSSRETPANFLHNNYTMKQITSAFDYPEEHGDDLHSWWTEAAPKVKEAFNKNIEHIKDPTLRSHIENNFNQRMDHLQEHLIDGNYYDMFRVQPNKYHKYHGQVPVIEGVRPIQMKRNRVQSA